MFMFACFWNEDIFIANFAKLSGRLRKGDFFRTM